MASTHTNHPIHLTVITNDIPAEIRKILPDLFLRDPFEHGAEVNLFLQVFDLLAYRQPL
jgi:hypothetical protein